MIFILHSIVDCHALPIRQKPSKRGEETKFS